MLTGRFPSGSCAADGTFLGCCGFAQDTLSFEDFYSIHVVQCLRGGVVVGFCERGLDLEQRFGSHVVSCIMWLPRLGVATW